MGFVKTPQEIDEYFSLQSADFYNAEILSVYWETKPEIIENILPPPLKPVKYPVATAFVANYPKTNFGVSYREAALSVFAKFEGVIGMYCLAMPVDNDIAMILGRESLGYPKKFGEMTLTRDTDGAHGIFERHGTRVFEVKAKFTNKMNASDAMQKSMELGLNPAKPGATFYNFKFFQAPDFSGFDFNPRLMREEITFKPSEMKLCEAEIEINHSDKDPWSQIEVERVLGAIYLITDTSMLKGSIVAETDPESFRPFAYTKIDPVK